MSPPTGQQIVPVGGTAFVPKTWAPLPLPELPTFQPKATTLAHSQLTGPVSYAPLSQLGQPIVQINPGGASAGITGAGDPREAEVYKEAALYKDYMQRAERHANLAARVGFEAVEQEEEMAVQVEAQQLLAEQAVANERGKKETAEHVAFEEAKSAANVASQLRHAEQLVAELSLARNID